ncbi:MAG: hypothetical protein JWL84_322 [Rhodospirillales bacterium]|nr:hypothetical protein [Rhodospirillales bacterium]
MNISTTVAVDDAVAAAKSLPDLVNKVSVADPSLALALQSKALIASKTPWGTLLATGAAYLSAKYGLGWSESFCELIALGGMLVGSYAMRAISPGRISGLFKTKPVPASPSS